MCCSASSYVRNYLYNNFILSSVCLFESSFINLFKNSLSRCISGMGSGAGKGGGGGGSIREAGGRIGEIGAAHEEAYFRKLVRVLIFFYFELANIAGIQCNATMALRKLAWLWFPYINKGFFFVIQPEKETMPYHFPPFWIILNYVDH